jgi:hypothetical protein
MTAKPGARICAIADHIMEAKGRVTNAWPKRAGRAFSNNPHARANLRGDARSWPCLSGAASLRQSGANSMKRMGLVRICWGRRLFGCRVDSAAAIFRTGAAHVQNHWLSL